MSNQLKANLAADGRDYPSARTSWTMVVLLTVAYIFSYVDRYILSLLAEPIKADLGISDTDMGLLLGFYFAIFYATMGIPLGWLADRKRRTWIVAVGVTIWSLATVASGFAKQFWHLAVARFTVGAGEAALSPCAMSMISDSFPKEKRGRPIGFYTAGLSVGAGVAGLVSAAVLTWTKSVDQISLPLIGEIAPWQFTFIVVGLPGLLIALLFLLLPEPKRQDRTIRFKANAADGDADLQRAATFGETLTYVFGRSKVFASYISLVCLMTIVAYSQFWFPAMFDRTWGWEARQYAVVNAVILLAVGPLTVNLAGAMSDKFTRRKLLDGPLRIMLFGAFLLVPTAAIAPMMPSPWIAMGIMVFNTIGIAALSATSVTALLQITPGQMRGQVVAIYYMVISMAGLFIGPPMIGWLSDNVFGNENLRYACAMLPILFGLPILALSPWTRRWYIEEVQRVEASRVS